MMARIRERLEPGDEGISLVELIIYTALAVVILAITAGLFISSVNTSSTVTEFNQAAATGQLIASSVEEGVRNASGPTGATGDQVSGIKSEVIDVHGQLLRARVAVGLTSTSVEWRCMAWYFSSETHSVYSATSKTGLIADPKGFTATDGVHKPNAGTADWTLVGEGVYLADGAEVFFGTSGIHVVLKFKVRAEGTDLVLIPSTVVKHTVGVGGTGPSVCY